MDKYLLFENRIFVQTFFDEEEFWKIAQPLSFSFVKSMSLNWSHVLLVIYVIVSG